VLPLLLAACYDPPDLPPFEGVPIVAAPPEGCRPDQDEEILCTVDGDTFDIGNCGEGGERFRMLGVDAPET
jgi:endonuclease YncB( thermonuclease family)